MGYRAHTIKQHREYGEAVFWNYDNFEKYQQFLFETYPEEMELQYCSETEEYYEIPKIVFQKEIERLKQLPPDDEIAMLEVTNRDWIENLTTSLREATDDDNVAMEWF